MQNCNQSSNIVALTIAQVAMCCKVSLRTNSKCLPQSYIDSENMKCDRILSNPKSRDIVWSMNLKGDEYE